MRKHTINYSGILLIILLFTALSCEQNTNPIEEKTYKSPLELIFQNSDQTKNGFLYSTKSTYIYAQNRKSEHQVHYAYFYDDLFKSCEVEQVLLNSNVISQVQDTDNVVFDGITEHIWQISGGNCIPSFSDTIISINTFEIIQPIPSVDTIFKANGIYLQYTQINNIDSIFVYAMLNKWLSSTIDTNYWTSSDVPQKIQGFPNTGSIYLSPSFLQVFPTNSYITIEVIAFRNKERIIENKHFIVGCAVSSRADYILK